MYSWCTSCLAEATTTCRKHPYQTRMTTCLRPRCLNFLLSISTDLFQLKLIPWMSGTCDAEELNTLIFVMPRGTKQEGSLILNNRQHCPYSHFVLKTSLSKAGYSHQLTWQDNLITFRHLEQYTRKHLLWYSPPSHLHNLVYHHDKLGVFKISLNN